MCKINPDKYAIFLYRKEKKGKKKLKYPKMGYLLHKFWNNIKENTKETIRGLPKNLKKLLWFIVKIVVSLTIIGLVLCIFYPLISGSAFEEFIINLSWDYIKLEISSNPWNIGWFVIYFALLGFIFSIAFYGIPKFLDKVIEWGFGTEEKLTFEEIEEKERREKEQAKNAKIDDFIF